MSAAPRIVVLTTGGTIASRTGPAGAVPELGADDLLADAPAATRAADVTARSVCSVDSSAMTDAEHRLLADAVRAEFADDSVTGLVITHGTDTLEETAMFLDLTAHDQRPVVLTGARHTADSPLSDGPANLLAAVTAAADPDNRGRGVIVTLGGRVFDARGLYKVSTTGPAAFDTVRGGLARPLLGPVDDAPSARVDIVALHPDFDPAIIAACVASGARGLVLCAMGSGNAHPVVAAAVREATHAGTVVVVSTRVPDGEVVATYGGGGGAVDLVAAGGIISPWLRPPQVRIALSALLTRGATAPQVADFLAAGGPRASLP